MLHNTVDEVLQENQDKRYVIKWIGMVFMRIRTFNRHTFMRICPNQNTLILKMKKILKKTMSDTSVRLEYISRKSMIKRIYMIMT